MQYTIFNYKNNSPNYRQNMLGIYEKFFQQKIVQIKKEQRYRYFQPINRIVGQFPKAKHTDENKIQTKVTIWCTNDYLAMGQNIQVINAIKNALENFGTGAGGTRNISGTNDIIVELEEQVAKLHKKPAALVFSSGYVANETILQTIAQNLPDTVIFSDSKNHASLIQGIRASKAKKVIFKHNDIYDLETKIKQFQQYQYKIIAFESLYSMDGDVAPVKQFCQIAQKYQCLTYLDEVHAVGLYGKNGAGIAEQQECQDEVDIIQATFAKAFGIVGGYMAASEKCIDFIRSTASGFIFSTAMPPYIAAGSLESIRYLQKNKQKRQKLHQNVASIKQKIKSANIPTIENPTHIIPVMIADAAICNDIAQRLLQKHHIYIQPINYPTVKKNTERLRITVTPQHGEEMQNILVEALKEVFEYFQLKVDKEKFYRDNQ